MIFVELEGGFIFDDGGDEGEALEPEKEVKNNNEDSGSAAVTQGNEEDEITLLTELFGENDRLYKKTRKIKTVQGQDEQEKEAMDVDDASADEDEADISNDELEYLNWKRSYYIDKFKVPNPSR